MHTPPAFNGQKQIIVLFTNFVFVIILKYLYIPGSSPGHNMLVYFHYVLTLILNLNNDWMEPNFVSFLYILDFTLIPRV